MKVSIIIPIYNVSEYIERCLLSALNQTYDNIEYLLINDATPDDSFEKAKAIIKNHSRKADVILINHIKNLGLSAARNHGIKASTGDYLFFLDSDDELPENAIANLIKYCWTEDENLVDAIVGSIKTIGKKVSICSSMKSHREILQGSNVIFSSFLSGNWPEIACNKLLYKDLFVRNNELFFVDGLLHEDTLWAFKLSTNIRSIVLIKETTYLYHIRPESITQNKGERNFESIQYILEYIVDYSFKHNLIEHHSILSNYIINLCYFFCKELTKAQIEITKKQIYYSFIKQIVNRVKSHSFRISFFSLIKIGYIKLFYAIKL